MAFSRPVLVITMTWIFAVVIYLRTHRSGSSQILVKTAHGYMKYSALEEDVFIANNFKLLAASKPLPMLDFITKPTCEQIYVDNHAKQAPREWKQIPSLLNVPVEELEGTLLYGKGSMAVYHALNAFPQRNRKGLVVGSQKPWVEVFALRNGAREVVTLEYQNISISGTDRVKYVHPIELAQQWQSYKGQFDFVLSFSTIEHSGLGRYGDPLDPIGDLREVWKITCLLKPGGYFFLGVPTGQDAIVFNLHRIYGVLRLAMVMTGFEWVATYSGDNPIPIQLTQRDLEYYSDGRHVVQYLYVLKKTS
ncbi:hypothetical protein OESDEN_06176 [Oesophagostomum dentatum]|uniref:Methyltransferase type 11 domain-containing protein n=1 Tax=Oesophagostomum dentatum TaxID=61180 RepID=A0A0B1TCQ0_OESDE|nr:hypothetical protein OESDEN_06176 [Oesophagostomum dentatum]